MAGIKERVNFTLSRSIKKRLEAEVPKSKRSRFVENVLNEALNKLAKRELLDLLDTIPRVDIEGRNSVEVLDQLRVDRQKQLASRHS